MFLYFFIFYYRLHCLVHNTHSLVLQCLSSSGVFDDWIILFAYLTGFKTVLPLSVKDVFLCVCSVSVPVLPLCFYWSHAAWKVFNNVQQLQNYDPWWRWVHVHVLLLA